MMNAGFFSIESFRYHHAPTSRSVKFQTLLMDFKGNSKTIKIKILS